MDISVSDLFENLFAGAESPTMLAPTVLANATRKATEMLAPTKPEMLMGTATAVVAYAEMPAPDPIEDTLFGEEDWILRPDHAGVMGWERPGIPEADRWWVRCSFDNLPDGGPGWVLCRSISAY
jgi:hypothetical protein